MAELNQPLQSITILPEEFLKIKKWPEGYVFPACLACNNGSKDAENKVSFLSQLGRNKESLNKPLSNNLKKLIDYFKKTHPEIIKTMTSLSANEKKRLYKNSSLNKLPGETYAELPLLKLPESFEDAVQVFGGKLIKSLHFHHTNKIAPKDASIKCWMQTNYHQIKGETPDTIFSIAKNSIEIMREKTNLKDQFDYQFQATEDGTMGIYTAKFRSSFWIFGAITFDPILLEKTINEGYAMAEAEITARKVSGA